MEPEKLNKDMILIVDDNPKNLQVLGNVLTEKGYEVAAALSGESALDFVKNENPDLILLDIMMPEMDGFEVCRRLKMLERIREIPVIFLTAKTETEEVVKGFNLGAVDYITKPFKPTELLVRVRTHIDLKKAREEIKTLRGIVPVCANCKNIRDNDGEWMIMEEYISKYSEAKFSHSCCPDCVKKLYPDLLD